MTPGPYEARHAPGIRTDCCDFGIISLSQGREICRVWERDDAEELAATLNGGWQSIETRPEGDKPCWVAHAPTSTMVVAYPGHRMPKGVWYILWSNRMMPWTPTHWMPLPTPPIS